MKNLSTIQVAKLTVIYKLCAGICKISELSDEEKIYAATCLQRCKNTSKGENERWGIDWAALGLTKLASKDRDGVWKEVAQIATGAPVIKTSLARKTIPADWDAFPKLTDELLKHLNKDETSFQNVYNIYEATGQVVHKRQLEKLTSDAGGDNTATKIIDMMKRLNPTIPQMAQIQKYMHLSIRNKTKAYKAKFLLPEELLATRRYLAEKVVNIIPMVAFLENKEKIIANLGLMGYHLAVVEPEYNTAGDIKYFKKVELLDAVDAQQDVFDDALIGLAHNDYAKKPTQTFRLDSDKNLSKLTTKIYLDALVARYKANRDTIHKYLVTPKAYYINHEDYTWNFHNIALDIYCNEKLAVNPDTFYLVKNLFQGKEPVEWLNEI